MRLSNELDQNFVRAAVPDGAAELLSFLPSLGTAETMVFGESVNLPMRVILSTLAEEYRPHSSSAQFTELWKQDHATSQMMSKVFDRWRARSMYPNGKPLDAPKIPTVQDTRAALRQLSPARHAHPAQAKPQSRPQTQRVRAATAQQQSPLAAQVRERMKAKAAEAPSSLADVKSMLNSAFHKNI
jgi:hypothetical protein